MYFTEKACIFILARKLYISRHIKYGKLVIDTSDLDKDLYTLKIDTLFDTLSVLQDRHIQERQRRRHIPAAVGVRAAGMVASRSLIVGIIVLYKLCCVLRQRIN